MAKAPSGNDVLIGTGARDRLDGEGGDDRIEGRGGDDLLEGGTGNDTMDGGAGDDDVRGEDGDDRLTYVAAENAGDADKYSGGKGHDTLVLNLTRAEWMSQIFQWDLLRLTGGTGQDNAFDFWAFDLSTSGFDVLEIVVDGVAMSAGDNPVVVAADMLTATEDAAGVPVNVLANDQAADLVRSVTHTQAAHGAVGMTLPAGAQSAAFVYTPDPGYWQHLAAGQTGSDSFTYTVYDADYDRQTATVSVVVHGVNDAPVLLDSERQAFSGAIRFRDVDLTDAHAVSVVGGGPLGTFSATVVENTADADNTGRITWSFTPDPAAFAALALGETASQTYTLTLTDPSGAAVATEVTVTLTGVNDAPVGRTEVAGQTEQDIDLTIPPAVLLANDTDPDGDALTIVSVSGGVNGTAVLTPQGVVFAPASGFTGQASFDYTISDGKGGTATTTAFILVEASAVAVILGDFSQADLMTGGPGRDHFNSRGGHDLLYGMGGNDTLIGAGGRDAIFGGEGDDVIGAMGQDDGDDEITGGPGDDRIFEGAGSDTYRYVLGDGSDIISDIETDGGPVDVLRLEDINPDGVFLRMSGTSLVIVIKATRTHAEEEIEIVHQFDPDHPNWGIEEIRFADNTVWTDEEFETLIGTSSPEDFLFG